MRCDEIKPYFAFEFGCTSQIQKQGGRYPRVKKVYPPPNEIVVILSYLSIFYNDIPGRKVTHPFTGWLISPYKGVYQLRLKERLHQFFRLHTEIFDQYEGVKGYEKALEKLDEGFEDAIQFMNEPIAYHDQLRTTNNLEGINSEVRRREQVIRIFPNTQSAFRLIGALLKEHEENLDRGNRTFLKGKPADL